jgi:diadenosine tetraphosphate (Ap4A) HIT family hydrolase
MLLAMLSCDFCTVTRDEAWIFQEAAVAIISPSPLAPGHILVAPRRHVARFYGLDVQEQHLLWEIVGAAQKHLAEALGASGFSIGFADFESEGQGHTHVHVVPRKSADSVKLPQGIEWVAD